MTRRPLFALACMITVVLAAGCATTGDPLQHSRAQETALDKYVHTPDPAYSHELVNTIDGQGYTGYVIKMVSQTYLTENEVNRPTWWHWLTIVKPDNVTSQTSLLFVGGGSNEDEAPEEVPERYAHLALATGTPVAEIRMVPNQPLIFADEERERYEDAIIAYTWDKFLRTGDEKWPLRLPMTKSVTSAMDTVQDFLRQEEQGGIPVTEFVIAGGSKRGWTTWTTGATDTRVKAIIPIVIDMLNVVPSFQHHWEVYGFWAPAVDDYVEMGTFDWMGSPEERELYAIVEPFSYRGRYNMPKFIMNASGDEFFLPDSSQFYWDALPGEKVLRYVPNSKHSMSGTDAFETLLAFYHAIVNGTPRPRYFWNIEPDNSIRVWTKDEPVEVNVWHAHNPEARDFRVDTIGEAWEKKPAEKVSDHIYVGSVETPEQGWTAFMVELVYPSGAAVPFKFTTQVHVVPDETPFEFQQPEWPEDGFIRGN